MYTKHIKKEILQIYIHNKSKSSSKPFPCKIYQSRDFSNLYTPISHRRLNSQSENLFNPFQLSFKNQLTGWKTLHQLLSTYIEPSGEETKSAEGSIRLRANEPLTSKVSATAGCPSPPGNRARDLDGARVIAIYCSSPRRNKQY